jgi:hypothetical protein
LDQKVFTTRAFGGVFETATLGDGCMIAECWRRNPDRRRGEVFTTAVSSDFPTMQAGKFKRLFTSDPFKSASSIGQSAKTG